MICKICGYITVYVTVIIERLRNGKTFLMFKLAKWAAEDWLRENK